MASTEPTIVRMNLQERLQHGVMFISFTTLAVTGFLVFLPEHYVAFLGISAESFFQWRGIIHRIAGIAMILISLYHIGYVIFTERGRWVFREMIPRRKDLDDLRQMIRVFMDVKQPLPQFGWYNYVEKAEYWALVWGTAVMSLSGLLLWFEFLAPKLLLDIATIIHRYEAILAVSAIFVWHFYHVHWKPEVFPMSPVWIKGHISEEELLHRHPLAYETIMKMQQEGSHEH